MRHLHALLTLESRINFKLGLVGRRGGAPEDRSLGGLHGSLGGGGRERILRKSSWMERVVINDQQPPVFIAGPIIHVSSPAPGKAIPG